MNIIDLTDHYITSFIGNNDLVEYERSFPELFDHYFTHWGHRDSFVQTLTVKEVHERKKLIEKELPLIEKRLLDAGLDVSEMNIVLFVGQGYTNGHAFRHDGQFYTFLALEGYETRRQVLAHVTHEILHAVHYTKTSDFYFQDKGQKELFSRMVITEGLATLLTKEVMGMDDAEALWADYIPDDKRSVWMHACDEGAKQLFAYAIEHFNDADHSLIFYTADENDIFKYRAGYYIGCKVLEEIAKDQKQKSTDLLNMPRVALEGLVLEMLHRLIGSHTI